MRTILIAAAAVLATAGMASAQSNLPSPDDKQRWLQVICSQPPGIPNVPGLQKLGDWPSGKGIQWQAYRGFAVDTWIGETADDGAITFARDGRPVHEHGCWERR